MMPSVQAQALIRRNAEEQTAALNDFSAWQTTIKQNDANIQKKRRQETNLKKLSDDSTAVQRNVRHSTPELHREMSSTPSFLSGMSNSIVIGGQQKGTEKTKVTVATAPQRREVNGFEKSTKEKEELEEKERQKGNSLFSDSNYYEAIKKYDLCIELNPSSPIAYSNRAMAHLKLKDWQSAESDASSALSMDELHIKSYQRRSAARLALGKVRASLKDLYLAQVALEMMTERDSAKIDGKKGLSTTIKTRHVENELKKVIKHAPKRKVKIQIQKSNVNVIGTDTSLHPETELKNNISSSVRKTSLNDVKSWVEFQQIWKSGLQSHEKGKCLECMKPHKFNELYKNGMEDSDLLLDIAFHCSRIKEVGANHILALSRIPSIDMVVMMLSKAEKKLLSGYIEKSAELCSKKVNSILVKRKFGINK